MNGLDWNDELKLELSRLKSELTPESMQVLKNGIGIGQFRKLNKNQQSKNSIGQNSAINVPQVPRYQVPLRKTQPLPEQKNLGSVAFRDKKGAPWALRFWIFFYDLLFTILTLILGTLALGLTFDYEGFTKGEWFTGIVNEMAGSGQFLAVCVILGSLYLIYRVTFKLVIGKTLGETIAGQRMRYHE